MKKAMKSTLSHKRTFLLTLLGYVIIGAASSGFYQQRYFHQEGLTPFFWITFGIVGSIVLIFKNIFGGNKAAAVFVDLCFIIPVVFIPLIPARHDIMLILMLLYACAFVALYVFKNYKSKDIDA